MDAYRGWGEIRADYFSPNTNAYRGMGEIRKGPGKRKGMMMYLC